MNKIFRFWVVCLFLIFIDFFTKLLVKVFNVHYSLINYTLNFGGIFGLFNGMNFLFIIFGLLLVFGLLWFFRKELYFKNWIGFCFIISGAIGNLIDRIFYSGVVDFIDLKYWYVFNLADVFIVIGMGLILFDYFIKNK